MCFEFARMIAENGTPGTDHGRATAMFALGGPVCGGTERERSIATVRAPASCGKSPRIRRGTQPAGRRPGVTSTLEVTMRIAPALALAAVLTVYASPAFTAVKSRVVDYTYNGTELQGYMAWDDDARGKRAGVLVVHEWWGHNAHARRAAERLARAGYVAFALDMFGKGKLAAHPAEAQAFVAEATKDAAVTAGRFDAALALLKQDAHVDTTRIGAIGYCFGGGVVLGRARSGADLKAIGTFHGSLATEHRAEPGRIKAKLLVQTGSDDPMVPAAAVAAFEKEMTAAGANYRLIRYPGAKHAFTNPDAGTFGVPGLEYNAEADRKSWVELLKFFKHAL